MSATEPMMRAAHTRSLLSATKNLAIGERRQIGERVGSEDLERIEAALPLAWTSMDLHMKLSDAVRDVIGPERNVRVWCAAMSQSLDRPLLAGFVRMSTSLFGITPVALFRQSDRIYKQLTKELGTMTFEGEGSSGTITLRGFPSHRWRFACYVEGTAGCLEATANFANVKSKVEVLDVDDARGNVRFGVRW